MDKKETTFNGNALVQINRALIAQKTYPADLPDLRELSNNR